MGCCVSTSPRDILDGIYLTIASNLDRNQEIRIEGHADCRLLRDINVTGDVNLKFAADRAMSVYNHLRDAGIDPKQNLMSASSFGAEQPLSRKVGDKFPADELRCETVSEDTNTRNRRIEVVLIYR